METDSALREKETELTALCEEAARIVATVVGGSDAHKRRRFARARTMEPSTCLEEEIHRGTKRPLSRLLNRKQRPSLR